MAEKSGCIEQVVFEVLSNDLPDWSVVAASPGMNEALRMQCRSRLSTLIGSEQAVTFFLPLGFGAVYGRMVPGDKPFVHALVLQEQAYRAFLGQPEMLCASDIWLDSLDGLPGELPRIEIEASRIHWKPAQEAAIPPVALELLVDACLRTRLILAVEDDALNHRLAVLSTLLRALPVRARRDAWFVLSDEDPQLDAAHILFLSAETVSEKMLEEDSAVCVILGPSSARQLGATPSDQIHPYIKALANGMPTDKQAKVESWLQLYDPKPGDYDLPWLLSRCYDVQQRENGAVVSDTPEDDLTPNFLKPKSVVVHSESRFESKSDISPEGKTTVAVGNPAVDLEATRAFEPISDAELAAAEEAESLLEGLRETPVAEGSTADENTQPADENEDDEAQLPAGSVVADAEEDSDWDDDEEIEFSDEDAALWRTWMTGAVQRGLDESQWTSVAQLMLFPSTDVVERVEALMDIAPGEAVVLQMALRLFERQLEELGEDCIVEEKRRLTDQQRAFLEDVQPRGFDAPCLIRLWEKDPEPIDSLIARIDSDELTVDELLDVAHLWLDRPVTPEQRTIILERSHAPLIGALKMSTDKPEAMRNLLDHVQALPESDIGSTLKQAVWKSYADMLRSSMGGEDVLALMAHRQLCEALPDLTLALDKEIKWRINSLPWSQLKEYLGKGESLFEPSVWDLMLGRTWLVLKTEPMEELKDGVSWLNDQKLLGNFVEDIAMDDRWAQIIQPVGREWSGKVALRRLQSEWGDRARLEKLYDITRNLGGTDSAFQRAFNECYRPTLRLNYVSSISDIVECAERVHAYCAGDQDLLDLCRAPLTELIQEWVDESEPDWDDRDHALEELGELHRMIDRHDLYNDSSRALMDTTLSFVLEPESIRRLPQLMDACFQACEFRAQDGLLGDALRTRVPQMVRHALEADASWGTASALRRTLDSTESYCIETQNTGLEEYVILGLTEWARSVGRLFQSGARADEALKAALAVNELAEERKINGERLVPLTEMGGDSIANLARVLRSKETTSSMDPLQLAALQTFILQVLPDWDAPLRIQDPTSWVQRYGGLFAPWLSPRGRAASQQILDPIFNSLFGTQGPELCRNYVRMVQKGSMFEGLAWGVRDLFGGVGAKKSSTFTTEDGMAYVENTKSRRQLIPYILLVGVAACLIVLITIVTRFNGQGEPLAAAGTLPTASQLIPKTQAPPPTPSAAPATASVDVVTPSSAPAENAAGGAGGAGTDATTSDAAELAIMYVTDEAVNLREGPSTSSQSLSKLPYGLRVTALDMENDWIKVKAVNSIGYVNTKFLSGSAPPSLAPLFTPRNRSTPRPTTNKTASKTSSKTSTPRPKTESPDKTTSPERTKEVDDSDLPDERHLLTATGSVIEVTDPPTATAATGATN